MVYTAEPPTRARIKLKKIRPLADTLNLNKSFFSIFCLIITSEIQTLKINKTNMIYFNMHWFANDS